MKPWFVKEADIIKFPEPEKKVIELPNVQSYPDFLTGVKDLYNRKAKGEISQDSHDRLYQDLIHRFMKKESFETPWFLREASLSFKKLTKDPQRVQNFLNYIKNGTAFTTTRGPFIADADQLAIWTKALSPSYTGPKPKLKRTINGKEEFISLSNIEKTRDFGSTQSASGGDKEDSKKPTLSNKGLIAEGILGAGLFAKFIKRDGTISVADITQVLDKFNAGENEIQVNDIAGNVADTFILVLKMKKGPGRDLFDKSKRPLLEDEFNSVVKFANGPYAKKYSSFFARNGKADTVKVISDGVSAETTTKTDVFVQLPLVKDKTGKPRVLKFEVSLKSGAVRQIGQIGGADFDKQIELWELFGVDVKDLQKQYESKDTEKEKLAITYEAVAQRLGDALMGDKDGTEKKVLRKIEDAIKYFATRRDPKVRVVKFDKGDYKMLDVTKIDNKMLDQIDLTTVLITGRSGLPTVIVKDKEMKDTNYVVRIRVKTEKNDKGQLYFRNIIEMGPMLEEMLKIEK
jgi:hypothetical protein